MSERVSPVLLRREIGRRLRAARQAASLTLDVSARHLDTSVSSLSRIENGTGIVTVHLVRSMSDLYDCRMDELIELVRVARRPGWWKTYGIPDGDFVALETGASALRSYEPSIVPGLLRTADYTRALFQSGRRHRDEEWIINRLAVRAIRQERLTDDDHPLRLDTVIHEYVLHHPIGGPAVMRAQLRHLALIGELPTVTLHVLPASVISNEAMHGGFTILDFPSPGQPTLAYVQHVLGAQHDDRPDRVHQARLAFDHLRSLALSPKDSVEFIDQVAGELQPMGNAAGDNVHAGPTGQTGPG